MPSVVVPIFVVVPMKPELQGNQLRIPKVAFDDATPKPWCMKILNGNNNAVERSLCVSSSTPRYPSGVRKSSASTCDTDFPMYFLLVFTEDS